MDQIAADLPLVMDSELKQQVEKCVQSFTNDKGMMTTCFSTAEYSPLPSKAW